MHKKFLKKISFLSTSPERGQNLKDASLHKKSGPLRFPGRSGRLRFLLLLKFGNCGNLWKWIGLDLRLSWPVARLSGSITNAQPSIGQLHFTSNAIVMDLFVKGIQIKIYVFTTIDFVSLHCNYHRLCNYYGLGIGTLTLSKVSWSSRQKFSKEGRKFSTVRHFRFCLLNTIIHKRKENVKYLCVKQGNSK